MNLKHNKMKQQNTAEQIIELLKNKEFKELIDTIIKPITDAINKNGEREILLQKDRFVHQKEGWNAQTKIVTRWQIYNFGLFLVAILAIGVLGWLKILPETIVGTLLAALIGYALGERDRKRREDKE